MTCPEVEAAVEILQKDVAHLREVWVMMQAADKAALKIAAAEMERRLGNLNNEYERINQIQLNYVPREVYEARSKEQSDRITALERRVLPMLGGIAALWIAVQVLLHFVK
jgi:hypothetical protein